MSREGAVYYRMSTIQGPAEIHSFLPINWMTRRINHHAFPTAQPQKAYNTFLQSSAPIPARTRLFPLNPKGVLCDGLMLRALWIVGWRNHMVDWLVTGYLRIF